MSKWKIIHETFDDTDKLGRRTRFRSDEEIAKVQKFKTRSDLIKKFREVHGDYYDYSKVVLEGTVNKKVTIICSEHGEFVQRIKEHIIGRGCWKCSHRWKDKTKLLEMNQLKRIPIDFQLVEDLFSQGLKFREVAKHFKIHHTTLKRRLKEEGLYDSLLKKYRFLPNKIYFTSEELIEQVNLGLSTKQIAEKLKSSPDTIRKKIRELNNV